MIDNWHPVGDYGCGWEECPLCGPRIAVHKKKAHEAVVKLTWFRTQATLPEESEAPKKTYYKEVRDQQRAALAEMRVKRVLTKEQRVAALELLARWPVREQYMAEGHVAWASEVWLELENPRVTVAAKEGRLSLLGKMDAAVNRVHDTMRRQWRANRALRPLADVAGPEESVDDVDPAEVLDRGD